MSYLLELSISFMCICIGYRCIKGFFPTDINFNHSGTSTQIHKTVLEEKV